MNRSCCLCGVIGFYLIAVSVVRLEEVNIATGVIAAILDAQIKAFDWFDICKGVVVKLRAGVIVLTHHCFENGVGNIRSGFVFLHEHICSVWIADCHIRALVKSRFQKTVLAHGCGLLLVGV